MNRKDLRGFSVRLDLPHDVSLHMWAEVLGPNLVRIGMDPLGVETSGTIAQLAVEGGTVQRGSPFGSLEAEKYVGPLVSPLSGEVVAVNDAVVADPGLVERDPYGEGWLIELAPSHLDDELTSLATGAEAVEAEFVAKVEQYRKEGVLSE